jgi:hypothetical protein
VWSYITKLIVLQNFSKENSFLHSVKCVNDIEFKIATYKLTSKFSVYSVSIAKSKDYCQKSTWKIQYLVTVAFNSDQSNNLWVLSTQYSIQNIVNKRRRPIGQITNCPSKPWYNLEFSISVVLSLSSWFKFIITYVYLLAKGFSPLSHAVWHQIFDIFSRSWFFTKKSTVMNDNMFVIDHAHIHLSFERIRDKE